MLLLDLKNDQYHSHNMDWLPENPKSMGHHDLLVDALREEPEDTVRELRALVVSLNPRS